MVEAGIQEIDESENLRKGCRQEKNESGFRKS
jgi:hypothetical protein